MENIKSKETLEMY